MRHDGFVHLVAADAHRTGIHDTRQGDDRDFRGAAPDVHHHVGGRLLNREVGPDGGGHGLFNKIDFAGARALGGFLHRALFHLRDAGGHAHHDPGPDKVAAGIVHLGNEMAKHGFGHFKVGDDPILHGADSLDVARGTPEHTLGVLTDGQHHAVAARVLLDGDDGGFAQDDALPLHIHAGIGGPQVDGEIVGKRAENKIHEFWHTGLLTCLLYGPNKICRSSISTGSGN